MKSEEGLFGDCGEETRDSDDEISMDKLYDMHV